MHAFDTSIQDGNTMRRFIRHPSQIPIDVNVIDQQLETCESSMVNVGAGGLCFSSNKALKKGNNVHISIPVELSPFEVVGQVAWCQEHNDRYIVGVSFPDDAAAFSVRMVEQVCHIEQYRLDQEASGRAMTSEEAAQEWVDKYAADFPKH